MSDRPYLRLSAHTVPVGLAPRYDRTGPASLVHLGVGAFARAHLGTYADALLRAGHPALIHGVSLRTPTAERQLAPQDGLYTLTERDAGGDASPQILGAFRSVETGPQAAVLAIGAPATTMVTLTVTEKGYDLDVAPAVVAAGLAGRDRGVPAPVIASLDNVADNGALLRARVIEAAGQLDNGENSGLAHWISDQVRFPSSVVDRMVPATTSDDLDVVAARLGLRDEGAVLAEAHCSWVLERVDGLLPFDEVGVEVVPDVGPYQRRKLWLLNLPHSAFAYAGLLAGCTTIAEAAEDPTVVAFVDALIEDVLVVAGDLRDARAFAQAALRRFRNPTLGHTCRQVGMDGSQKLPQRLLPVVAARRDADLPVERFAVVVALWSAAVLGVPLAGRTLPSVEDRSTTLDGADRVFLDQVDRARQALVARGLDVLRETL